MRVWRLSRRAFASSGDEAYSGEGASRRGARWNSRFRKMAYASESQALALLEYLVHIDLALAPKDLTFFSADIPDSAIVDLDPLLPGWDAEPHGNASTDAGDAFLEAKLALAVRVPSVILPAGRNVLINPLHADFPTIVFGDPSDYAIDPRLTRN